MMLGRIAALCKRPPTAILQLRSFCRIRRKILGNGHSVQKCFETNDNTLLAIATSCALKAVTVTPPGQTSTKVTVPPIGMFDISAMLVLLVISFLQTIVLNVFVRGQI